MHRFTIMRWVLTGVLVVGLAWYVWPASAEWVATWTDEGQTKGAITGVGEITKTSPTGASSTILHYGKTGSPQTADFAIDVSNAEDLDCNDETGDKEDAGLHEADTDWICSPQSGYIEDGRYTSEFTPGNEVKLNISIKCRVFEGHGLSHADGNNDDYVEKTWDGKLHTFMVALYSQPGDHRFTEEDTETTMQFGRQSNVNLQLPKIEMTGHHATPGAVPASPHAGANEQDITWNVVAETDTGAVGGIRGSMSFTPYIEVNGKVRLNVTWSGVLPLGSAGTVVAAFSSAYSPYAGAAVSLASWLTGTGLFANYAVIGESIIENGSGSPQKIDFTGSTNNTPYPWTDHQVDFAPLSTSVAQSTQQPSLEVRGGFSIKTQLQCHDNSGTSEISASLKGEQADPWGDAKWGSTRPSFSPPAP